MLYQTSISPRELKAMLPIASANHTRFMLNGVHVDVTPDAATLVATDGRRLCRFASTWEKGEVTFTIPSRLIKLIPNWKRCDLSYDTDTKAVKFYTDGLSISGDAIDGNYPAWRAVIPAPLPTSFPSRAVMVNPDLFVDALSTVKKLRTGADVAQISAKADDDCSPLFIAARDVLFVLMPIHPETPTPIWNGQ